MKSSVSYKGTHAIVSEDVVDALLLGAIDTHIHSGPDVTQRKWSDLDVGRSAQSAGYKAVVVKCHVTPTASRAMLVQQVIGKFPQIFGGLVLNKTVGGLNPTGVEAELNIGAKIIWLPTFWSESHVNMDKRSPSEAVRLTDDKGTFRSELIDIFDLISKKDVILATGHATSAEIERFIPLARTRGIRKILITHPEWILPNMSIDVQKRLARQGVFFERCAQSLFPTPNQHISPRVYVQQIQTTGVDCNIMATDFGQAYNPEPIEGMRQYIRMMLLSGLEPKEIEIMIRKNPAYLLGIY